MSQTVSKKIFEAFFVNLAQLEDVKPDTIESLKALYSANRMAESRYLDRLAEEMENRYAQVEDADR